MIDVCSQAVTFMAVYFFHPAVHWIVRKIREEHEVLCDQHAVRIDGDRVGYAEFLLSSIGDLGGAHRRELTLGLLQGVTANYRRVRRLLSARSRTARGCLRDSLAVAGTLVVCVALVVFVPGLRPLYAGTRMSWTGGSEPEEAGSKQGQEKGELDSLGYAAGKPGKPAIQKDAAPHVRKAPPPQSVLDAVARGLRYLADSQNENGSWSAPVGYKLNVDYRVISEAVPHAGVTALSGMTFLAAGHRPGEGRHGGVIDRAAGYIVSVMDEDGFISDNRSRMYSHGYATRFLAEVYLCQPSEELSGALERAVSLLMASQNKNGSWSYEPSGRHGFPEGAVPAYTSEHPGDLSVTCCQIRALQMARRAGIEVPAKTLAAAFGYLRNAQVPMVEPGQKDAQEFFAAPQGTFAYRPGKTERTSFGLTATALACLFSEEGKPAVEKERAGIDYLEQELRILSIKYRKHYFYYYGHLNAAEALAKAGAADWEGYWSTVSAELLESQQQDGAWPNAPGPGSVFATAIAVWILAHGPV
ncbi:MAG: hypothetical protein AB1486_05505 [Planctomycetota bacterium]